MLAIKVKLLGKLASASVQFEGLAPALLVYSEIPASGAHLRTIVTWLCAVVPLRGESDVYVARHARLCRGTPRAVGVLKRMSFMVCCRSSNESYLQRML